MAWNNHQRLLSYFRIFWENIFFLSGTYLESCRWGHMINHYVTRPVTHDVTRPYWFSKAVLWELASFLMQTNSFVPVNVQGCWSRGWKRSICNDWELRQLLNCPDLKKKILKANYQSKHCTMTEALQRPWRLNRMRIFHINLLTYKAMFTSWNPTGTEASLSIKSRLWCSNGTIHRKALYFLHSGTYRL